MKRYVLLLLFTKDFKKVLLIKRNKKPYANLYNGIGGKIENNETVIEATIRECKEETNIHISNPKLLVTCTYPKSINAFIKFRMNLLLYSFIIPYVVNSFNLSLTILGPTIPLSTSIRTATP